jgi:two-component system, LuxR family, response regulator FixJ
VRVYNSAAALLADNLPESACLTTNIRMPGMDGMELQAEIVQRGVNLQIIVITGHGDISLAVRALRAGATDFLEKPFSSDALLTSVRRAIDIAGQIRDREAELKAAREKLALLTPRERDVFDQIAAGKPNKMAAYELQISVRTVEVHRAHIMIKYTPAISLASSGPPWRHRERRTAAPKQNYQWPRGVRRCYLSG